MISLTVEQKDLLLEYYFGCCDEQRCVEAARLIAEDVRAAEFYNKLTHSLSPLDTLSGESCPDYLHQKTLARIEQIAFDSSNRLHQLLKQEQSANAKSFWANFSEVATIAAAILIFVSVYIPITRNMRYAAWRTKCQAALSGISNGMVRYSNEHDQSLPAVQLKAGAPWWKVGYGGDENYSNTRHLWLLVKNNYLEPELFVCPSRAQGRYAILSKRCPQI